MNKLFSILLIQLIASCSFAQNYWQEINLESIQADAQITASEARYFNLDIDAFKDELFQAPVKLGKNQFSPISVNIPMADGTTDKFMVFEAPIMEEGLAIKYPNMKTFLFLSHSNQLVYGRADITKKGFHLMLFLEEETMFIDPVSQANNFEHLVYFKSKFQTEKELPACMSTEEEHSHDGMHELEDNSTQMDQEFSLPKSAKASHGATLRTYRLAVSTTAEYTAFHGGTVADGLAAVVTTVNRINGVYEREFTVRLVLVANNDDIIYTDASTDPFTNPNNASTLLNENQSSITSTIGASNYDIGHVVGRSGSGLASYGVVCRSFKAQGTTGISNPVGDPFDIDYVAHEIGHQFAGSHTFNSTSGSCSGGNLSSNSAYEPGGATTIMGYAGICAPHNVQNNSDDYFHTRTFEQVTTYITQFQGNNCPVKTATGNAIPQIQIVSPTNKTIPKSTPFDLEAFATDSDGDAITYCWEQFDLGPNGDPNTPSGNAPIFRSFPATTNPIRTFPQISDIVNNTQTLGEILPSYQRDMLFKITVRDNVAGGGAINNDEYEVSVSNSSGPFLVSNPNTNLIWNTGDSYLVEWDVANSDQAPVNCFEVNVRLSLDGGYTYPITLASNVINNGTTTIIAPAAITTQARVRVEAADNIFFDISDQNFEIQASCALVDPTINLDSPIPNVIWCEGTTGQLSFEASAVELSITSYQWYFNGNAISGATNAVLSIPNIQAINAGDYYCEISNGCETIQTNTASILTTTGAIIPTITQEANQLISSVQFGNQWYLDGVALTGETGQILTVTQAGIYSVESTNGSCADLSGSFVITSIQDLSQVASIQISPNPSTGNFKISTDFEQEIELTVYNLIGQEVLPFSTFTHSTTVDLSKLVDGVYIATLKNGNYVASYKLLKQ